jgi:hypothetical protein
MIAEMEVFHSSHVFLSSKSNCKSKLFKEYYT